MEKPLNNWPENNSRYKVQDQKLEVDALLFNKMKNATTGENKSLPLP